MRACQSPLPVASTLPAGLRSIEMTKKRLMMGRGIEFQGLTRIFVSLLENDVSVSNKARAETRGRTCSMHCTIPVLASQNWTPRSFEPETTHSPSCETATDRT